MRWMKVLNGSSYQQNYRSCFTVVPDELGDLDQPYEILNQSSGNYLTVSQVDSAIYVFRVKILDPNYRFDTLEVLVIKPP